MTVKDYPCKRECAERSETCHGDCERYKQYRAAREDAYRENLKWATLRDYTLEEVRKSRKGRRSKRKRR